MQSDPFINKSSTDDIRRRFDADVERFANLDTGQEATMDAPVAMDLITRTAVAATPAIRRVLDVGCGAGNNTLKLLEATGSFDCDLVDLSRPMLDRALERIGSVNQCSTAVFHGDFRNLELKGPYDVILAAAVLHHLRDDADWEMVFEKLYHLTAPGGSVWITDLVAQETPGAQRVITERYADYLTALRDAAYCEEVFAYIDREDSPRSVTYQMELLRRVGFRSIELLHKNGPFAAFGAIR